MFKTCCYSHHYMLPSALFSMAIDFNNYLRSTIDTKQYALPTNTPMPLQFQFNFGEELLSIEGRNLFSSNSAVNPEAAPLVALAPPINDSVARPDATADAAPPRGSPLESLSASSSYDNTLAGLLDSALPTAVQPIPVTPITVNPNFTSDGDIAAANFSCHDSDYSTITDGSLEVADATFPESSQSSSNEYAQLSDVCIRLLSKFTA